MGNPFGFVTPKEVVVAPWFKKPDVEFFDASGELLTIYLDVTLPALHQEAITSREEIYRKFKCYHSAGSFFSFFRISLQARAREKKGEEKMSPLFFLLFSFFDNRFNISLPSALTTAVAS